MTLTKQALYMVRRDPSDEGSSPSHEEEDAGERHQRLTT